MLRPKGDKKRQRSAELPTYFSVIDPGTTSLRVLVVEVSGGRSTVWGWAEKKGWAGEELHIRDLLLTCEDLQAEAEQMARDRADRWFLPDQMLVGLPASQLRGRAWPVTQRRSRPERPVDERELEALLGRALRLAINRLWGGMPETTASGTPEWLLVDALPVDLSVDGRRVTDPVGFRGREIGATVFAALGRVRVLEAWQLVAEHLEFSTLILMVAPLALAAAQTGTQGILVDIGGAATDLTWWRNGRPLSLESLATGGGAVTRTLIRKWGLSRDRAERLKWAYASGKLHDEARAQVLGVMSPALQAWLEETEVALARLNDGWDEPLPQRLDLLGGGSALPEAAEAIAALAWSQRLYFDRYPQVCRLRPTDVPDVVNRTELGRREGDIPALALAAWAAHESRTPDRPTRILGELCQE